jgi:hypothetical protein
MSARTETIFIPWLGPSANEVWSGQFWAKRKRFADDGHLMTYGAIQGLAPFDKPVSVLFQPIVKAPARMYDWLNYFATVKPIEDAIVTREILANDNPQWVTGGTIKAPQRGKESGMIVTISEKI